ncbi:hypothetical protein CDAR_69481 [Caerostris darwini]|uniref:Uncharacterized protein n=1 Tax=Caerostris darwini TaxID=1538125 RepID=A0AAV4U0R1_9ARAC|nr:hypothetical protein CDAR_69481 [Caerostris darwini]
MDIKRVKRRLSSARNTSILRELEAACHSKNEELKHVFNAILSKGGHSSGGGLGLDLAGNSPIFSSWGACGLCFLFLPFSISRCMGTKGT